MVVRPSGPALARSRYPAASRRSRSIHRSSPNPNEDEMAKRDGQQQGAQPHDEAGHGDKTHAAFIDGLHGKHGGSEESEGSPQGSDSVDAFGRPIPGRRRLEEDREQHDEAEKNSEANRLRG
ncbi:MAG: hypothetical protein ACHQWU_17040 [Gemmatimonadales bacterium]